jgi:hypothetical protein
VLRTYRIGFIIEIVLGRFRLVSGCPGGRESLGANASAIAKRGAIRCNVNRGNQSVHNVANQL